MANTSQQNNKLTHQKVANIIRQMQAEDQTITPQAILEKAGCGDQRHAEALMNKILRQQQSEKEQQNSTDKTAKRGTDQEFYYGRRVAPFSYEQLAQQPEAIQKLFWAVFVARCEKAMALEHHQSCQNTVLDIRVKCQQNLKQIRRDYEQKISNLKKEYSKLQAQYMRDKRALQQALSI